MSYEATIKTLLRAASGFQKKALDTEEGLQYHINCIADGEREVLRLNEQASAMSRAAATLVLMDKAGVTMKVPGA